MLTSTRVARREKGRRGNPMNRYSSTLKCGNDCVLDRIFFTTPVERAARSTPRHKGGRNRYCRFSKARDAKGEKRQGNCMSIYLGFKYLKIAVARELMQIQDAHHQYA